jgi:hypothetical protein
MDNWRLAIRVLAGAWVVLVLILLVKLGAAITGHYTVNWSQELAFLMPIVITSAGAVAAITSRAAGRGRGVGTDTANDTDRTSD